MRPILICCIVLAGLLGEAPSTDSDKLVIGVMGDQSGVVADVGGKGSVLAARMAVADFGGQVLGRKVELVTADHQNKPDVAASIARRWFDSEGVEAIADLPHTGVVLGLQEIARAEAEDVDGVGCGERRDHRPVLLALHNALDRRHLRAGQRHGARRD